MEGAELRSGSKYECLLFDMDDTLYPLSLGFNTACRKNIQDFMQHRLNIEEDQVPRMCLELYEKYGTTFAGLKALGYEFDDDEFHAYVHGRLPYDLLMPDTELRELLLSMPQKRVVFTNADRMHVDQVLSRLGIEDCFHGVISFESLNKEQDPDPSMRNGNMNILCKPSVQAMEAAIRIANADPERTILFDDSSSNIASGKAAGLRTANVGRSSPVPGADIVLSTIHCIKEVVPEIWES